MPQLMIEGQIDSRDETIRSLRDENAQLRTTSYQAQEVIQELRKQLQPLYRALESVFGVMQEVRSVDGPSHPQRTSAVWDAWKQRLGGLQAKFIDALLLHGGMTQTQLRIAAGCANGSVAGVVCQLNKAGLITKRDGKIFLKEL